MDVDSVDVRCGAKPSPLLALANIEDWIPVARLLCDQFEAFSELDRQFELRADRDGNSRDDRDDDDTEPTSASRMHAGQRATWGLYLIVTTQRATRRDEHAATTAITLALERRSAPRPGRAASEVGHAAVSL
jgi:hypothetical protein